jgi:predicted DCC family thiol-disulfide oxidoreductase YuxK
VRFVPWQFADLKALGLHAAQCRQAVQWVGADGTRAAGSDAFARLLRESTAGWRGLGWLLAVPPLRPLARVVYRWVAANRDRLPGGTPACSVRRPPGGPAYPARDT